MHEQFPDHRLLEFGCLTEREIDLMQSIGGRPISLDRNSLVRSEGCRDRSMYVLIDGWVASSLLVQGGKRQIARIHLPGDMLATTSMCVDTAVDTLTALTPITFRKVSLEAVGQLLASSPRIAAFLLLSAQQERIALIDRLASVAQTDPLCRLAAFLLDVNKRLRGVGQSTDDRFLLPMTQEQIGELLGFTAVHANRMLRELEREGLIERTRRVVQLLDTERLGQLAGMPVRNTSSDSDWFNPTDRDDIEPRPTRPTTIGLI
jgi:CRP/FNR family transcriptional regulator, anaerobic regulatory protein